MAVQFALRPRIRLEQAEVPRRRLRPLRVHPLVLPIGVYWLTITAIAHAVIEHTRHPPEMHVASDAPRPEFQPPSLVPENAPEQAIASPSTIRDDEPSKATTAPEAPGPIGGFSGALARDTKPAIAPIPTREREPDRTREQRPRITDTAAHTPPAPPPTREEPASLRRETNQQPPEEPVVRSRGQVDDAPAKSSLPSCEAASESAEQTIDIQGPRGAPDLPRDAFANILENGAYLGRCAIPARTAIEICAAVQGGKVVGVSVRTEPRDSAISNCVRRAVAALRFPVSARLDVTRTRFEATR
jgi:hypothetical protein